MKYVSLEGWLGLRQQHLIQSGLADVHGNMSRVMATTGLCCHAVW
jgi:hypothetical protein